MNSYTEPMRPKGKVRKFKREDSTSVDSKRTRGARTKAKDMRSARTIQKSSREDFFDVF